MNCDYHLGLPIGQDRYASPAQFLLMCGFLVFESKQVGSDLRQYARHALDEIFAAATSGGFTQVDLLETCMSIGERSQRLLRLASLATAAIGDTLDFIRVLKRAGICAGEEE